MISGDFVIPEEKQTYYKHYKAGLLSYQFFISIKIFSGVRWSVLLFLVGLLVECLEELKLLDSNISSNTQSLAKPGDNEYFEYKCLRLWN